jgi:hypothetical protein
MNLGRLLGLFRETGCTAVFGKYLAENDNSKNQIYLGGDLKVLNILPSEKIFSTDTAAGPSFKAKIDLSWLQPDGHVASAPHTQIILYAQYPEVRLSGFLRGCTKGPNELLNKRIAGRVMLFGIAGSKVISFVMQAEDPASKEIRALKPRDDSLTLFQIKNLQNLDREKERESIIAALKKVHLAGWIDSKQLSEDGKIGPCRAPQCGGFTLEAELGIPKNSKADPDLFGYEVKQYGVKDLKKPGTGRITLMTPEPDGGTYKTLGVEVFIRSFGYKDKTGRPDRLNFGGIHKASQVCSATGLTMQIDGFDPEKSRITRAGGSVRLETKDGEDAASWSFANILEHWKHKHANAVYVASENRKVPQWQYRYGNLIRICTGTDGIRFLKSLSAGKIFYDPGIKLEQAFSDRPRTKRRSQFRVQAGDINELYENVEVIDLNG